MSRKKLLIAVVLVLAVSLLASAVYAAGFSLKAVKGSGGAYLPTGGGGQIYGVFEVLALEKKDGTVKGHAYGAYPGTGRWAQMSVDCLNVFDVPGYGTAAVMSGWQVAGTLEYPYLTWFFIDGGPGGTDYSWRAQGSSGPEERNCHNRGTGWGIVPITDGGIVIGEQ